MLAMVEQTVVAKRKYIEKEEFWDLIAVVQSLPGVFAINTALYVGYKLRGKRGALVSAAGAALPSFIAILLIAMFFVRFEDNEIVEKIFRGIRPCVVALILSPGVKLMFGQEFNLRTVWIPIIVAFVIWRCCVSPVYVVLFVIVASLIWGVMSNRNKQVGD